MDIVLHKLNKKKKTLCHCIRKCYVDPILYNVSNNIPARSLGVMSRTICYCIVGCIKVCETW